MQKRGPGFKFASNLPGSLLKEFKEGEDGGRRKSEDLGRPRMEEYHSNRRKSDDGLGLKRRKDKDLPTDLGPRKKVLHFLNVYVKKKYFNLFKKSTQIQT